MNDRYIAEVVDKIGRAICLSIEKGRAEAATRAQRRTDALDSIAASLSRISTSLETIAARSASDDRRWPQ